LIERHRSGSVAAAWPLLSHSRSIGCYAGLVSREVSVRDLRNHTGDVVAAVRAGERVSLTVNRLPVADIVPHAASPSPWVPAHSLRAILDEAGADSGLLTDLGAVREDLVDDA
jgi:prevent-host-death family protein